MTSSRFFAGASTSGVEANASTGSPTPRRTSSSCVRELVRNIRARRLGRRSESALHREERVRSRAHERLRSNGPVDDLGGEDDDESDMGTCAICLDVPRVPAVLQGDDSDETRGCATASSHVFCLDCIDRWSAVCNACPLCKARFSVVVWSDGDGIERRRFVEMKRYASAEDDETASVLALELERVENTTCEACGGGDCEESILLCDGCDAGCHTWCCTPPLPGVPEDDWFCPTCDGRDSELLIPRAPGFGSGRRRESNEGASTRLRPEWRRRRDWYRWHTSSRRKSEGETRDEPEQPIVDVYASIERFRYLAENAPGA